MIYLGEFIAGAAVKYRANFHSDQGTLEDPTDPEAQLEIPAGTFGALTAPAKINSKTGHFGGSIDTTGFADGEYVIRMAGTVSTAKVVATEFCFKIFTTLDSNVTTWKGTAAPDIATESDIATAVNDHISAAVSTPSPDTNTATTFKTTLPSAVDDFYNDMLLTITSGALIKQVKKVTNYDGTSKVITVGTGFTGTPADGVTFDLVHQ